ncbi:dephospho-CoA kinase [Parasedimentitalea psychrophila]|uniref:Dephospho-CoA kinase n=1 Tax=Parasedimentitalea psychrophila TaxID=2997337 RepID=A0A9Y2L2G9_9RHOB|nr:dephospho-CoA kinase [Parasedimentitalea psychrophila]WIY26814.1 dephospho-CoA kinase [Parasedimentitalea psychrophila]
MTFNLGLTGSIGMGKSTTAGLFATAGCAVWDADAAVHRLYAKGGAAVSAMQAWFPDAIKQGQVDRMRLKELIAKDPQVLSRIESIVHPLVAQDRDDFRRAAKSDILVFDIPLLFEIGGNQEMDAVACVMIDAETQQSRVLARGTMSVEQFLQIRHKQLPIEDKIARSDYVIVTDTLDHARAQVARILADVREKIANA